MRAIQGMIGTISFRMLGKTIFSGGGGITVLLHLMVLSLSRTVFFLFACPGMMNVRAMYLDEQNIKMKKEDMKF